MQGRTPRRWRWDALPTRVRSLGKEGRRSSVERVIVSPESGEVVKVVPAPWFRVFFRDLAELLGAECAWRGPGADSVPRLAALMP